MWNKCLRESKENIRGVNIVQKLYAAGRKNKDYGQ